MWDSIYDFYIIITIFGTFSVVVLGVGVVMKDPIVLAFASFMGVATVVAATSVSISEPIKPITATECTTLAAKARAGYVEAIEAYRKIHETCARIVPPSGPRVPATVQ